MHVVLNIDSTTVESACLGSWLLYSAGVLCKQLTQQQLACIGITTAVHVFSSAQQQTQWLICFICCIVCNVACQTRLALLICSVAQAWVLGALQSEAPRPYYWAAALYALPLLRNGLDQDWFSWTLLLLGVAHVQVRASLQPCTLCICMHVGSQAAHCCQQQVLHAARCSSCCRVCCFLLRSKDTC